MQKHRLSKLSFDNRVLMNGLNLHNDNCTLFIFPFVLEDFDCKVAGS